MAELERVLMPGPTDQIRKAVVSLLMAYPASGLTAEMVAARVGAFCYALEDMPAWAVEKAALAWLRGEGGTGQENYQFAPSPAQLYRLAGEARAEPKYRHWATKRLLEATPETPKDEETYVDPARLREVFEKVAASNAAPAGPVATPRKPNLDRVLDECEARKGRREAGTTPTVEAAE